MKFFFSHLLIIFISTFLVACTQKTLYLTPETTGYIYSIESKKPIANYHGYIGYDTARDSHNSITTDSKGKFKISPETLKYYLIKPSLKDWNMSAAHIYIQFPGYRTKIYDYSEKLQEQVSNSDPSKLEQLDVGIIFLSSE
ncbi:hypothetical protein [Acinetobacter sp. YH16032]|uniref:hypothetical protein n=1 Tax=Acinetobacter sp. YH16032 TaxID=2601181 RepID=UPI0015D259E1|nr:hypothetical protein [Acinetobacter sp. YH16032]